MIPRYTRPEMASIWSDENKFRIWLKIEIFACEAMHKLGIVPVSDLRNIKKKAKFDIFQIHEIERDVKHDVIAFLTSVERHVGASARFIHRGLTSSDILDTGLAVQMVQATDLLIKDVELVRKVVAQKARRYKYTPMIGRTHGIHAEPITFGFKMAVMYDEFGRELQRLNDVREHVAVGKISGAVGTYAHLSPVVEKYVCKKLGLKPAPISTQIIQRDIHAEYLTTLALVGASVERWALEFRHLQRTEVREVEEFFASKQKGSSAMPHKKNPITGEKLCGLARVLRGNMVAGVENVALWHERDISHSSVERIIIPDSTILLDHMLAELASLVKNMEIYPDKMLANLNLTTGLIHSQQLLLALTSAGLARDTAYRIVQAHAMRAWQTSANFEELVRSDERITKLLKPEQLNKIFNPATHFKNIDKIFRSVGL